MLKLTAAKELAKSYGFSSLITEPTANAKLAKSVGFYNAGISLAQSRLSGYNVCKASTAKCRGGCLGGTGRAEFTPIIEQVRIARTKCLFEAPAAFRAILEAELAKVDRAAKRLNVEVAFRPNILSDIDWPMWLFDSFPNWRFYSYTKLKSKVRKWLDGELPANYHVTYSWSERAELSYVQDIVASGVNVAVPFYNAKTLEPGIPTEWNGMRVIDGDESDLRFLDPSGVIVGLKVKLPKRKTERIKRIKKSKGFFVGF